MQQLQTSIGLRLSEDLDEQISQVQRELAAKDDVGYVSKSAVARRLILLGLQVYLGQRAARGAR